MRCELALVAALPAKCDGVDEVVAALLEFTEPHLPAHTAALAHETAQHLGVRVRVACTCYVSV
jgi:sirohydrochlorin ferrochelatase